MPSHTEIGFTAAYTTSKSTCLKVPLRKFVSPSSEQFRVRTKTRLDNGPSSPNSLVSEISVQLLPLPMHTFVHRVGINCSCLMVLRGVIHNGDIPNGFVSVVIQLALVIGLRRDSPFLALAPYKRSGFRVFEHSSNQALYTYQHSALSLYIIK
jgi:hypothetical protein